MIQNAVTKKVYERLPIYLDYLTKINSETISSTIIARNLNLGEVQVRKDLALVSGQGRPKIGYLRVDLIQDLRSYLGLDRSNKAIVIGFGRLGKALYEHKGFNEFGLNLVKAFDLDTEDIRVEPMENIAIYCKENNIKFAILTVPNQAAQEIANHLVECGILGIWNFTSIRLDLPENIIIQNENLATSFAVLIKETLDREENNL